jgi:hypothetical protein
MRVYIMVTVAEADAILREGFTDLHADAGREGVWCWRDQPLGCWQKAAGRGGLVGCGTGGEVTLCAEVPEDTFRALEIRQSTRPGPRAEAARRHPGDPDPKGHEFIRLGYAIIPAEVLNRQGRPQIYDHEQAGSSRRHLVQGHPAVGDGRPGDAQRRAHVHGA